MKNEFNPLTKVVMARPTYMKITEIINEVQKQHAKENIDVGIALRQHEAFANTLKKQGVEVSYLETGEVLNEQVFTRDIGFVIDELFCVAHLKESIRKAEKEKLLSFLEKEQKDYYEFQHPIEGGDILPHGDTIFVGLSQRTTKDAVEELKKLFPHKQIVTIELYPHILHLDCVFTILNERYALLYQDGMTEEAFYKIKDRFTYLKVTKKEQETMATNVLAIGSQKIISLDTQTRLNTLLRYEGFEVIEQNFSEIIKSGGSFRCCTLPLKRKETKEEEDECGKQKKKDTTY